MDRNYDFENEVLQRLVRVEESTSRAEESLNRLFNKIDELIVKQHNIEMGMSSKLSELDNRVLILEQRNIDMEEFEKRLYAKLGFFIPVLFTVLELLKKYVGGH